MAESLTDWAKNRTENTEGDASVVIFEETEPNVIDVLLCHVEKESTPNPKGAWATPLRVEIADKRPRIVTSTSDLVRRSTFVVKFPDETWAQVPLRLWKETFGEKIGERPPTVVGRIPARHDTEDPISEVIDFIEGRPPSASRVDDPLVDRVDVALRNIVCTDTDERMTLTALVDKFLDRQTRARDRFCAESLGATANRAGLSLFLEDDPQKAEAVFASVFALGFHLHQDPEAPTYWSLVRDGVNTDAIVGRVPDTNSLLAYLVPTCPTPPLVCSALLEMAVQDSTHGEPAIIHLSKCIARLQDDHESPNAKIRP